jgi:hypothetical protein
MTPSTRPSTRISPNTKRPCDAADLVSIEDEHGMSLEGGSWSFQTWDEIP